MTFFITSTTLFVLSILALKAFLALWVYHDSQVKSDQPTFIWVLVTLLVPNFFGILVYFLFGRNRKDVPAPGNFKAPLIATAMLSVVSFMALSISVLSLAIA